VLVISDARPTSTASTPPPQTGSDTRTPSPTPTHTPGPEDPRQCGECQTPKRGSLERR